MPASNQPFRKLPTQRLRHAFLVLLTAASVQSAFAGDLSLTSLIDGERTGQLGTPQFLNNWGGPFTSGNIVSIALDATVAHSGNASIRANLGTIAAGNSAFFQTFSSQLAAQNSRQTRDLTRYESFEAYVRNDTASALNLKYEIKDYRDNIGQQAFYNFTIPAGVGWTKVAAPLNLSAAGWNIVGAPDLSRTYATSFVVSPQSGSATGSIYLDDFKLREAGPSIDPLTAPIQTVAERLAERQFSGLWSARNRTTGLIYNTSHEVDRAAMNTTGGVMWMLPAAIRRGWVAQADADIFAGQIAASLQTNLNQTSFLPTRFINPATAGLPGSPNEESSIDAAFMALALHNYKSQPTTSPALAATIDAVQNRFEFDAFAVAGSGFRLAYSPGSGFTPGTYDGYTNEGKVISLAADVGDAHHVPLESRWNSDTHRARVFLVNPDDAHLTHDSTDFRAPFEQALLNLFVDTSDRGADSYPNRSLATNPWQNYVRYERETAAKLDQLGRDDFFQPDAGDGGGSSDYKQYSLYNNFGQPDLFMPWSVSLALLAGAPGAEDALRALANNDLLQGPLGLADSARWSTGAAGPTNIPASQDNWNMVLSTMALLEFLDGSNSASRAFANLADVKAALDEVFLDGDIDGNGVTNGTDLAIWRFGFGDAAGATPANGDADANGAVDGVDFLRWQRGFGSVLASMQLNASVPEPSTATSLTVGALVVFAAARFAGKHPAAAPRRA